MMSDNLEKQNAELLKALGEILDISFDNTLMGPEKLEAIKKTTMKALKLPDK